MNPIYDPNNPYASHNQQLIAAAKVLVPDGDTYPLMPVDSAPMLPDGTAIYDQPQAMQQPLQSREVAYTPPQQAPVLDEASQAAALQPQINVMTPPPVDTGSSGMTQIMSFLGGGPKALAKLWQEDEQRAEAVRLAQALDNGTLNSQQILNASPDSRAALQLAYSMKQAQSKKLLPQTDGLPTGYMWGAGGQAVPIAGLPDPIQQKVDEATAIERAKAEQEMTGSAKKEREATATNLTAFENLRTAAKAAPSGMISNAVSGGLNALGVDTPGNLAAGDFSSARAVAENAIRSTFRVAGSGAQSDADAKPFIDMLPSENDSEGVKLRKIDQSMKGMKEKARTLAQSRGLPDPYPEMDVKGGETDDRAAKIARAKALYAQQRGGR